jgi:simple sugar transport system permease protein
MIFGNWRPGGLLTGSGLFGYTQTLGLRPGDSVKALLLAGAVLAVAAAYLQARRGSRVSAIVMAAVGVLLGVVYFVVDTVPNDFSGMTPYVITLLVLAFASQRLRMPAADGQIYRKGSAG